MKSRIIITLMILAAVLAGGCAADTNTVPPEEEAQAVDYELLDSTSGLAEEISLAVETLQAEKGFFVFTPEEFPIEGKNIILISAGEKPTSGYALSVESAKVKNNTLHITIKETEPAEDDIVAQVLTYPLVLVQIEKNFDSYQVSSVEKVTYPQFEKDMIPQVMEENGRYTGQVDNNFLEIEINGQPETFKYTEDLSWVLAEMLNEGDNVIFSYFANLQGEKVLLDIEAADRAGMMRDVSGTFNGQIDSHSVEIEVDGEAMPFAYAEQILINEFQEGDQVIFDYYEDEHGRLIINRMETR